MPDTASSSSSTISPNAIPAAAQASLPASGSDVPSSGPSESVGASAPARPVAASTGSVIDASSSSAGQSSVAPAAAVSGGSPAGVTVVPSMDHARSNSGGSIGGVGITTAMPPGIPPAMPNQSVQGLQPSPPAVADDIIGVPAMGRNSSPNSNTAEPLVQVWKGPLMWATMTPAGKKENECSAILFSKYPELWYVLFSFSCFSERR